MLSEAEFMAMPEAARAHYSEGIQALDHIDYVGAHSEFRRAAELAPDSAPIQFKLSDLSRRQGRVNSGRRAEDYLVVALEALQRVIDSPTASPDDVRSAEREMRTITSILDQASYLERERYQSGRVFLRATMLERDWRQASRIDSDMEAAVMTESGSGPPIMRSSVVLINRINYLYNPDESPFIRDGEHVSRDSMAGATFESNPEAGFFDGIVESTDIGELHNSFSEPRERSFSNTFEEQFGDDEDEEAATEPEMIVEQVEMAIPMGMEEMDFASMTEEERNAVLAEMFVQFGIEGDPSTMTPEEIDAAIQASIADMLMDPSNIELEIELEEFPEQGGDTGDDPFANPFADM